MSCIYSCVAYKRVLLVQHGETEKKQMQFEQAIQSILGQFEKQDNTKLSTKQNNYVFYVLLQQQVTYVCICDEEITRSAAFHMLLEIAEKFSKQYSLGALQLATKKQMQAQFQSVLDLSMQNLQSQKLELEDIEKDVEDIKGSVAQSINELLNRAENLNEVQQETEKLKFNAEGFESGAKTVKKEMQKKRVVMIICVVIAVVAVVLCIVLPIVL